MDADQQPNTLIQEKMALALAGNREAAAEFYRALLAGPLFVPERYQSQPISLSPQYPNDFVNVLGVQDADRVIVPVFSDPSLIEQWFGSTLVFKTVSGHELLPLIPEGWWACIDPGEETEKELSPWELERMKGEEIAEIIEEIFSEVGDDLLEVAPLGENEYPELRSSLLAAAQAEAIVRRVALLKERRAGTEEKEERILVGIETSTAPAAKLRELENTLKPVVARCLIGAEPARIFAGEPADNPVLGIFRSTTPLFERKSGLWASVKSFLFGLPG